MLRVGTNGAICLTRGDTARLEISITNDVDGLEYSIEETDTLTLTAKKSISDKAPSIQLTVTGGNIFNIKPSDTKHLSFGKYIYDVELQTAAGDVYTIIEPTVFELTKEVNC